MLIMTRQKRPRFWLCALWAAVILSTLVGCGGSQGQATLTVAVTQPTPTSAAPTSAPATAEPTQPPPAQPTGALILVQLVDNSIVAVDASGAATPFAQPGVRLTQGPGNVASVVNGKLYAISEASDASTTPQIWEISPAGARTLGLGNNPLGVAVNPVQGAPDHPLVALGEIEVQAEAILARLVIAPVDGFDATIAAEQTTPEGFYFAPLRWSADGQRLFYSEEPSGLGGYIPFAGFSSVYVYDLTTNASNVLLPSDVVGGAVCLYDLSADERLVTHACSADTVTILDITSGAIAATIAAPAELAGQFAGIGDALFSPDGTRIAFALARRDPSNEQGWVAVTDDLSGTSRLLATAPAGEYYNIVGWLDGETLILQSYGGTTGLPTVWLLKTSGGEPVRAADGLFVAIMPGQ